MVCKIVDIDACELAVDASCLESQSTTLRVLKVINEHVSSKVDTLVASTMQTFRCRKAVKTTA